MATRKTWEEAKDNCCALVRDNVDAAMEFRDKITALGFDDTDIMVAAVGSIVNTIDLHALGRTDPELLGRIQELVHALLFIRELLGKPEDEVKSEGGTN